MNAPQPSLYERIAQAHLDTFDGVYRGTANAAAVMVCTEEPSEAAATALKASFAQLGYSPEALGWALVDKAGQEAESEDGSCAQLFELIEALDPLCVVALSHKSTALLSRGYNAPLALEAQTLLLGRPCRCFENFEALLSTEAGKHKAWSLLKTLPKLGG